MKINKLKIQSFGKLNSVNIALDEKITVINAKNEAGKSTIAAFIRYMLYGFYSSSKKELSQNDKKKYTSWDGNSVCGELDFTSQNGKTYTAIRKNDSRTHSVILDKTGNPAFEKGEAGNIFLGVDAQIYEKSAFVGQGDIYFSDNGELEKAINNMAFSGHQDMNALLATEKLTKHKKDLLGLRGNTGKIHEINKELEELTLQKQKWQNGHTELLESESKLALTKDKLAQNNIKLENLRQESFNADCLDASKKLEEIEALKQAAFKSKTQLEQTIKSQSTETFTPDEQYISLLNTTVKNARLSESQYVMAKNNVSGAKEKYEGAFSDKNQRELSQRLDHAELSPKQASEKLLQLQTNVKKSFNAALLLTLLIITIPIAIFFWSKHSSAKNQLNGFMLSLGYDNADKLSSALNTNTVLRDTVGVFKGVVQNASTELESAQQLHTQNTDALYTVVSRMCKVTDKENLMHTATDLLEKLNAWQKQVDEQKKLCNDDYIRYSTLAKSVDINALSELAKKYNKDIPLRPRDTINREIRFYTVQNNELELQERELEKRTAVLSETLPKPAEMQSRISCLEEQKKHLTLQYNQLELAIQALNTASEITQSNLSPVISGNASEFFAQATGGKYTGLYTDENMALSFMESGSAEIRNAHYLSTGTLELAFISLRIALCRHLYKENPTLIFDDAFTHLDDERLKSVTELILKLSEDFQIVIMSCHDREAKLLADKAKIIDFSIGD